VIDHVELFYKLEGDSAIELKVQPSAAGATEERLRAALAR